jgi:hypothetical protein
MGPMIQIEAPQIPYESLLSTISFRFIKMSCTDSSIPIIAEYSCFMFSNLTCVIHGPSTSPSKNLHIAMPIVSVRPLQSGDREKRP